MFSRLVRQQPMLQPSVQSMRIAMPSYFHMDSMLQGKLAMEQVVEHQQTELAQKALEEARARLRPQGDEKGADQVEPTTMYITESCSQKIQELLQEDNLNGGHLRLVVEGGGCSGFSYHFELEEADKRSESDLVFEEKGSQLIIDPESFLYVQGSEVDYVEELIGSQFRITANPHAEFACGCGQSFALKDMM
eukprot:TRINITY_DN1777_c0_g1_i1.p1 TRINITY_DN1777_c0_g1~~TRINITY_DN1777_c0_g1_i1.p1  ORF type:complete len:192 (+),score=40.18 TRINITY_DN1777_c0_g1_i1:2-577(+)